MSETEPVATTTTAPNAESAGTADGSAAAAPTAASEPASSKSTVDIDKLLEQAAKASSQAREATRRAEAAEKARKEQDAEVAEWRALKAEASTDKKAAIKRLVGEGYKPQEIIEMLALDVEPSTDAPVAEQVAAAVKKIKDAEKAEAEALEKKRQEETAAARASEAKAIQNEFLKEVDAFTDLPDTAAKFPLSAAWAKKITPELVMDKFKSLVRAGQPCDPPDVMAAIEAGFQEEIDATPFGRRKVEPVDAAKPPRSIHEENLAFLEEHEARLRANEAPIKLANPGLPIPEPVAPGNTGRSVHDENLEYLAKLDREANAAFRLGHG